VLISADYNEYKKKFEGSKIALNILFRHDCQRSSMFEVLGSGFWVLGSEFREVCGSDIELVQIVLVVVLALEKTQI